MWTAAAHHSLAFIWVSSICLLPPTIPPAKPRQLSLAVKEALILLNGFSDPAGDARQLLKYWGVFRGTFDALVKTSTFDVKFVDSKPILLVRGYIEAPRDPAEHYITEGEGAELEKLREELRIARRERSLARKNKKAPTSQRDLEIEPMQKPTTQPARSAISRLNNRNLDELDDAVERLDSEYKLARVTLKRSSKERQAQWARIDVTVIYELENPKTAHTLKKKIIGAANKAKLRVSIGEFSLQPEPPEFGGYLRISSMVLIGYPST